MKSKNRVIVEIVKMFLNCLSLPFYFIKIFCDVAVLPGFNGDGEMITSTFYYYHSIYSKFVREDISYLLWIAVAITVISVILSVLNLTVAKDKKAVKIISHIAFATSVLLFFVMLIIAASIQYKY